MSKGIFWLRCDIARSAFSGERIVSFPLESGREYSGIAPFHYCRTAEGKELSRDIPAANDRIQGNLQVHLIQNGGKEASLLLPDGEFVTVLSDSVIH